MAELDGTQRQRAATNAYVPLLPNANEDDADDITTSVEYGAFTAGDWVTVVATEKFHMKTAGATGVTADATNAPFPAGIYGFVVPTGVTHFALFSAVAGALGNAWKS